MAIRKIKIQNFKGFRDFEMELNSSLNILVGDACSQPFFDHDHSICKI